jgi:hypothetical protein
METDIQMIATGYALAHMTIIAATGYAVYRFLRRESARTQVRSQSNYAKERFNSTRPLR